MTGFFKIQQTSQQIINTFAEFLSLPILLLNYDYSVVAFNQKKLGNSLFKSISQGKIIDERIIAHSRLKKVFQAQKHLCYFAKVNEASAEKMIIDVFPLIVEEKVMGFLLFFDINQAITTNNKDLFKMLVDLLLAKLIDKRGIDDIQLILDQLSLILNSIDEGIIAIDEQGVVINFNQKISRLMGRRPSQVLGSHINKVFPEAGLLEVLAGGGGFRYREVYLKSSKGSEGLVITANPILKGVKVKGVVANIKSIQEVHQILGGLEWENQENLFDSIIGKSLALKTVKQKALRIAGSSSSVLIRGESGTGKELFARAIHQSSQRCKKNFISINCAAIPKELLESELFGYESGAFTGAQKGGRLGKFELAHGGTIFLDEIGDMSLVLQAKILRVLQEQKFFRIGGLEEIKVNVRVIAATNQNLEQLIGEKKFREDLYYRLNVIPMEIPPLRKRREDIMLLAEFFIDKYNKKLLKKIRGLTDKAKKVLVNYDWPGNVRELENIIEYAINMEPSSYINTENIPVRILNKKPQLPTKNQSLSRILEEYERDILKAYLKKYGNSTANKLEIAQALGIGKTTLYNKLKKLKLL